MKPKVEFFLRLLDTLKRVLFVYPGDAKRMDSCESVLRSCYLSLFRLLGCKNAKESMYTDLSSLKFTTFVCKKRLHYNFKAPLLCQR